MRKMPKILDTKGCAVCGKKRRSSGPLCEDHEEAFLSSEHARPLRTDCRIETIESCYVNFVKANQTGAPA